MLCDNLDGRGVWGRMDTCICMSEFLCYPPETITAQYGITTILPYRGLPGGSGVKNLPAKAGDMGSIPGLGRSPGEGNGNLL